MAAIPSAYLWIPEDDLLLKNAVEAGASLEALSKGAVQFSRKFSFLELQDRWRSLLYDPHVSPKASAHMVDFQMSTRLGNPREVVSEKRKFLSVQAEYYTRQKRIRGGIFKSFHPNIHRGPNINCYIGNGIGEHERQINSTKHFWLQESGDDTNHHACTRMGGCVADANGITCTFNAFHTENPDNLFDASETHVFFCEYSNRFTISSARKSGIRYGLNCSNHLYLREDTPGSFGQKLVYYDNRLGVEETRPLQMLLDGDLARTCNFESRSTHNLDEVNNDIKNVFTGLGGVQHLDSAVVEGVASVSLMGYSSPQTRVPLWKMAQDDSPPIDKLPNDDDCLIRYTIRDDHIFMDVDGVGMMDKLSDYNLKSILLSSSNNGREDDVDNVKASGCAYTMADFGVATDSLHSTHDIQYASSSAEANVPFFSSVQTSPEFPDGSICCTLNTEDPEIPCNDDIFLQTDFDSSIMQTYIKGGGNRASSFVVQTDGLQDWLVKKEETSGNLNGCRITIQDALQQISQNHPCMVVSRHAVIDHAVPDQFTLADGALNNVVNNALVKDGTNAKTGDLDSCNAFEEHSNFDAERDSTDKAYLEPVGPSVSNHEELESDDDVPYSSDIEAMILEMDLTPYDQDSYMRMGISKYQREDAKRKIVRLEQCMRSSLQRAIASPGALAVLYGRQTKFYIKKAEVILGRATNEIDVDIDLGREGPANNISRRQARIKLETDGYFILENTGKSLIFVKGKEVCRGQFLRLSSSCLIEVKDLRFVFEVNRRLVQRFLARVDKKANEISFEWLPEVPY